jgi:hypothetical protein
VIRFDYWASDGDDVILQVSNKTKRRNYAATVVVTVHKAWAHAEIPVLDMTPTRPGLPLEEGDALTKIEISGGAGPSGGPFYVDNVQVLD